MGIPPDRLSRIFDPFYTTKEKGLGLGMAIAHRIIEDHKGSIDVESQVGLGTTFTIHLAAGMQADHDPAT
jgi:signal transduction histidine kinase